MHGGIVTQEIILNIEHNEILAQVILLVWFVSDTYTVRVYFTRIDQGVKKRDWYFVLMLYFVNVYLYLTQHGIRFYEYCRIIIVRGV